MYAEIVFPLPFRNTFTYIIPRELKSAVKTGVRAVVPFGKRTLTGFVVNTILSTKEDPQRLKEIIDVLDSAPVFTKTDLNFYDWLAEYYLCSLGEALRLSVPYGLEVESRRKIIVDREHCNLLLSNESGDTLKSRLLKVLVEKDEVSFNTIQNSLRKKNIYSAVKSLEKEGALTVLDELTKAKVKIKTERYAVLAKPASEIYEYIPSIESRSPNQVRILLELVSKKDKKLALKKLMKSSGAGRSSVDGLVKKGLIKYEQKEVERKYRDVYSEEKKILDLTPAQRKVVEIVSEDIRESAFNVSLLHGVTGSGKTQVYIELVKEALKENKSAIILVPEISLTPQMTSRLFNNFGELVTVIHSRMSLGERYDAWRRILKGKSNIVVGARSALFAPLKKTGLIVVDEEHDASYKQFESVPKYNARDSAIILAKINSCPVLLGSATPSIETMYNARQEKYRLLTLSERIDDAKLPEIKLVNVPAEKSRKKMHGVFTLQLVEKIKCALDKKEGVIILQNRRGFSTQIYCEDCGEIEMCENCSVPNVYHISSNNLKCHYCGTDKHIPKVCNKCGSYNIKFFGSGTERVEDELEYFFPSAVIKRVDSDSISAKASLGNILLEFSKGEVDILVGTQMVSKGLDFPRVTLVGVISAETTLWLPDFRADERTFQLLTQVAGRAGRSKHRGEVIIQTFNEKNFTLQKVLTNDYEGFYQHEVKVREQLGYPPFTRICIVESKHQEMEKARNSITDYYNTIKRYRKYLEISPPHSALISRLKGSYRYHLFIKSKKEKDPGGRILRKAVIEAFIEYNRSSRAKDVKLIFDIDPQAIM